MPKYNTRQRRILLEYFADHADEALSVKKIADDLADKGISISAVYRNIAELEKENKLRKVNSKNSRVEYRFTEAECCKRHMHLNCLSCGKTFHLDVESTDKLVSSVAKRSGFSVDSKCSVLYGVCERCNGNATQQ